MGVVFKQTKDKDSNKNKKLQGRLPMFPLKETRRLVSGMFCPVRVTTRKVTCHCWY